MLYKSGIISESLSMFLTNVFFLEWGKGYMAYSDYVLKGYLKTFLIYIVKQLVDRGYLYYFNPNSRQQCKINHSE